MNKADFLCPCPVKYVTHFDCPGCGFQRSVLALWNGDFTASLLLYPPTILLIISFTAAGLSYIFKWNTESKLLKGLYLAAGFAVVGNYIFKILTQQL